METFYRSLKQDYTQSFDAKSKFDKSIQEELSSETLDPAFLEAVYEQAFHTGDIPENRNHIAVYYTLTLAIGQPTSLPTLKLWIDLDKVAALLNAHYKINPPYAFTVKYGDTESSGIMVLNEQAFIDAILTAPNSIVDVFEKNKMQVLFAFMLLTASSWVCLGLLLVAALHAAAVPLAITTTKVCICMGIAALSGLASYGLFNSQYETFNTSTKPQPETEPEDLETIFKTHFEKAFADAVDLKQQNNVGIEEIIEDEDEVTPGYMPGY